MPLATEWVGPRTGDTAGELYDLVLKDCSGLQIPLDVALQFDRMDEARRKKITRLKYRGGKLCPYDVDRIAAAIWEYDEEGQS